MDIYEVRPTPSGFEVSGGLLATPLCYHEPNSAPIVHLVGFLAQRNGARLVVFDDTGAIVSERDFPARVAPRDNDMEAMLSGRGGLG